jgi:hypothetical protein
MIENVNRNRLRADNQALVDSSAIMWCSFDFGAAFKPNCSAQKRSLFIDDTYNSLVQSGHTK